jgi:phosphatidate phosphatase APP1
MEGAYHSSKQKWQETEDEKSFRKLCGFSDVESKMPAIGTRRRSTFVDNFTSYLGKSNPWTHPVNKDEHAVWLFDNTAWQEMEGGPWKSEVVSSFFVKKSGKDESEAISSLASVLGIAEDEEAKKTMAERLRPLLDTVLPAHTVKIQIGDDRSDIRKLGPGDRDGISNDIVTFTGKYKDGETLTSNAIGIKTATPLTTTFAAQHGWAVISDVDDTIKKTLTASPLGILRTTFVDEPTPVKGMPELYKQIQSALNDPPFWYLSASPYNLYPFLRQFRSDHFPDGTLILREASWMNLAGFLTSLTQGTEAYKVDRMKGLQANWPGRKFLCIGDSTQSDPEAYGEMYRLFPGWIGAIWIRRVADVEPMNESEKNKPERFEKAFEDVPREVWTVFEDPKELGSKLEQLSVETL